MSSRDQAFVKAFARRNRNRSRGARPDAVASTRPSIARSTDSQAPTPETTDQTASVEAELTLDQVARQIRELRAASIDAQIDTPASIESTEQPVNPLQHIHTAYASATDTEDDQATTTSDPPSAVPVAPTPETLPDWRDGTYHREDDAHTFGTTVDQLQSPAEPAPSEPAASAPAAYEFAPSVPVAPEPAPTPTERPEVESAEPIPMQRPFRAVWEVDVFDIPPSVADLFFEGRLFQQVAERMSEAVSTGLNSVLVTSTKSGEGRTTVSIGLAMASAAAGIRTALVDADTAEPTLADELRLDLQYGWIDTVRGGLPIREVAVKALEDGVTLVPLMPTRDQKPATAYEVVQLIDLLKSQFELIIIDGPAGTGMSLHECASSVDSALIVRDVRRTDSLAISEFSSRLRASGLRGMGIVENFS